MTSEQIVTELVARFNELPNRRKLYLKYVEREAYLLIEFGASEERCFVFKKYIKPHNDIEAEKQRLYTNIIEGVMERVYDLILKDKF
jgi:hypothetical protein